MRTTDLFDNSDPEQAWEQAAAIIRRINPAYDFGILRSVYDDTLRLFYGNYPDYERIKTPYHDLPHTLDVFLCAVRLMHGVVVSGQRIDDETVTLLGIAAMMHDIGYAQRHEEANGGTGAQFTQIHIERGINFIRHYLAQRNLPEAWNVPLACIVRSTSFGREFLQIDFPDQRSRLAGQILGSADLIGQMADRSYLEKLLLLYLEFKEAQLGNYQSMFDLLRRTRDFYEYALAKLDEDFAGIYTRLADHFRDYAGIERNYYVESIGKNLGYLSQVIALDETSYQSMLKRNGVVKKIRQQSALNG